MSKYRYRVHGREFFVRDGMWYVEQQDGSTDSWDQATEREKAMLDAIDILQRERDAYRSVAIEWFSCEGPFPENLADADVCADVDARVAEFAKQEKGGG